MRINFQKLNFKGYDAAPLKVLHTDGAYSRDILPEIKNIANKEGFNLCTIPEYVKWSQDFKIIIEKDKKPFIVASERECDDYLDEIKDTYGIDYQINHFIATGGNTFIGKYPNGEKWMLIGESEMKTKSKEYLFEEYGIKPENIFTIPQQYYHLDMFMRPIGYPFVLVDNPKLSQKKLSSLDITQNPYETIMLQKNFKDYEKERQKNYYPQKAVITALENAGFIPIEIAGAFGSGINFMNAIVNQHKDGTISYITNSTMCKSPLISKFQEDFEKELRQKVPNIRDVYFVKGPDDYDIQTSNYMMDNLAIRGGGLHCMTCEEPNFDIWG